MRTAYFQMRFDRWNFDKQFSTQNFFTLSGWKFFFL